MHKSGIWFMDIRPLKFEIQTIRHPTYLKPFESRTCSIFKLRLYIKVLTFFPELLIHQRCHSKEKPFSCDCGKHFAQKSQLNGKLSF